MYPYFQKNQKPNPSNSSKLSVREASPADPLRQFLAENPAFGTLLFQVTTGGLSHREGNGCHQQGITQRAYAFRYHNDE